MLLRSGKSWVVDFFVRRGWLVKRRRLRSGTASWNRVSSVAAECVTPVESLEDRTLLSTITVTSLADTLGAGAGVTLRDAIQAANTDLSVDGSVAGEAGVQNLIVFQAGLTGTIAMTSGIGQMTISTSMEIQGLSAANTIIDAQHNSRIFNITSAAGDVALDSMTIENGEVGGFFYGGGAVYSESAGNLTISNSALTGNKSLTGSGGAIDSFSALGGTVTVTNSTLSGNTSGGSGGAINTQNTNGTLTVTDSTLSGNSTTGYYGEGGAIDAFNELTVTNCCLSGNSTAATKGFGGAIMASKATFVTNSTLTGNSTAGSTSEGGAIFSFLSLTVTNSTIVQNHATASYGGGIDAHSGSSVTLSNTILAQNTNVGSGLFNGPDMSLFVGATTVSIHNSLIGDNTGTGLTATVGPPDGNGNLIGTHAAPIDPKLGPLANNGGPTQTIALLTGSPALDAGSNALATDPASGNAALTSDQRGAPFVRISGSAVDMGAFESQTLSMTVNSAADQLDAIINPAQLTLRDAVAVANEVSGATISFSAALNGTPILLTQGQLTINSPMTITGNGPANTIINAGHNSRFFNIPSSSVNVGLSGLKLENGKTTANNASGGAIASLSTGTLAISNCVFSGNYTTGSNAYGGAIFDDEGPVTITNSSLIGNSTQSNGSSGGAIQMGFGNLTISNSTLSGNFTLGSLAQGGAIHTKFGALTITDSTLSGNYTKGSVAAGGAINSASNAITLTNTTISGNFASGSGSQGGAINDAFANITATNSTIVQNQASAQGGGINVTSATVTLRNSILAQNTDNGTAPDLLFGAGTLVVSHSIVGDNTHTGLTAAPLGSPDLNGNLIGTHAVPINPQLDSLANNGGPTLTMALLAGSPAINAGSNALAVDPSNGNATLTTDERGTGFARIAGGTVDMGAVEIQSHPPATPTVNALIASTSTPVLTGTWDQVNAVLLQVTVNATTFTLGTSPQLASDGSGNWTLTTTATIPDGAYNVVVHTANDIGENGDFTETNGLIVETAAPGTPTVNSLITNQSKPVLTGTFDQTSVDKATVLQVTVNGTVFTLGSSPQLASDGSGNWTLTTTATIPDGTYTVLVQTANAAGFAANDSAANSLVIDTIPPVTPTATALVASSSTPVLSGTWDQGTPGGATVLTVTVNGIVFTLGTSPQLASDGSGHWTLTTTAVIPDGTYTVSVHTTDAAGNVANSTTSSQLLIETVGPISPTVNALTTKNSKPVLTGTFDQTSVDKATVLQVTVAGTTFTLGSSPQLASDGSGHWTLTTTAAIADGTYTVLVHTANAAGFAADDSATNALTVDTVPPVTPTVNALVASTSKPVLTGTWDEGTPGGAIVLQVTVNGATFTLGSSPQLASDGSGHWTLTTTTAIPDGTYTVLVHTADAAGNVANSTTANQLIIETAAPAAPTVNSQISNTNTPVLTGTWDQTSVDRANLLQVTVAGTTFTLGIDSQLASDGSGHWTLTTTAAIAGGQYTVLVHTANAAGFTADKSATNALSIELAPDIISTGTTFSIGTPGTFTLATSGFPTPALSESPSDILPSGVRFNATTGVLSGTPAPGSGGTYTLHFTAANGVGSNVTKPFTLQVIQTPAFASANNTTFTVGLAGSFSVAASGFPVVTLTESNTDVLPGGVTFNPATGVLSGTPAAGTVGGYVLHFTAHNGVSLDATQTFTLQVSPQFLFSGEYAVTSAGRSPTLASITQSGNTLTLNGAPTLLATVMNATQILVASTDIATYGNSSITFSSGIYAGQTWTKLDLPADYTNQAGAATHVVQNGASVTFVDQFGSATPGVWVSPTQLTDTTLHETVTVGLGRLLWQDGSIWGENLDLTGMQNGAGTATITAAPSLTYVFDYINGSGKAVHLVMTGTNTVVFIFANQVIGVGTFISPTQMTTPLAPNDIATISSDFSTVAWQDGTVWTRTAPTAAITVTDYAQQNGVAAHLVQNGTNQLAFIDGTGHSFVGSRLSPTTARADINPGDVATFAGVTITWQDGSVWTETNPVVDYVNGSGTPVHLVLTGANTAVFIFANQVFGVGTFINPTQMTTPVAPNDIATLSNNMSQVTWTDGTVWTQTLPTSAIIVTHFTNQNAALVELIQNGTNQIAMVDGHGRTSLGTMFSPTTAGFDLYPGDVATISGNTVFWQDGTQWNQTSIVPLTITFVDRNGGISHVRLNNSISLIGLDGPLQGVTGTRVNNGIVFTNGDLWANFDFNALNALFEMATGYP